MYHRNRLTCFLRQARRQPQLSVRDDHKYNQQHQQNVDQRDYIYTREYPASATTKSDSYESPRFRYPHPARRTLTSSENREYLLASFELGSNQAHAIDPGLLH
jgi:hypothetical protein